MIRSILKKDAKLAHEALGVIWAIRNPYGYIQKEEAAGIETDWFNPYKQIRGLICVKAITVPIETFFAWYVGQKAGYF